MKIAVVGGSGMIGSRIVSEAATRGHQVTSISRSGISAPQATATAQANVTAQAADITDSPVAKAAAADHDVVVSAIGPSRDPEGHPDEFAGVLSQFAVDTRPTRLIVVGGAGSLEAAPGVRLVDTPEFPEIYRTEALATAEGLYALEKLDLGDWTYLSPAPATEPGARTGSYTVGENSPVGNSISAEDFAVALVDEIEKPAHSGARFTVAN